MAGTVQADVADGLERQRLVVDLDAADRALRRADDVVVDDEAFERKAEQARVHAGRFVDQVGAGIADQRVVERLLRARPARRAILESVMPEAVPPVRS